MYAKSIIEHVRGRLAAGEWVQHLSFVPVVMALAVAALPFTLDSRIDSFVLTTAASQSDAPDAETQANRSLVKTTAIPGHLIPEDRRHAMIADYMARKFLVSRQVVLELVKTAHLAGRQYHVDPTLLVAVMAVESSFNPIAESVAGAKGLMQIIPHYHLEKFIEFGGEQAVFEPRANIAVGAKIIREYLQASSGNLFTALQTYAGALQDRDAAYTHKVLNEKDRLDAMLGLPRTDRGAYVSQLPGTSSSPAVQPAPGGRVQMTLPPSPVTSQPGTALPDAHPPKATEPLVALPVTIAAVRP